MDQLLTKLNAIDDPLMPPWAKLLIESAIYNHRNHMR